MMRGRRNRRDTETANFKRQAQALTFLTIATVILGGALFQADISIVNLSDQFYSRIQVALVLSTVLVYVFLVMNIRDILIQTRPIKGQDISNKIINTLLLEVLFAAALHNKCEFAPKLFFLAQ